MHLLNFVSSITLLLALFYSILCGTAILLQLTVFVRLVFIVLVGIKRNICEIEDANSTN